LPSSGSKMGFPLPRVSRRLVGFSAPAASGNPCLAWANRHSTKSRRLSRSKVDVDVQHLYSSAGFLTAHWEKEHSQLPTPQTGRKKGISRNQTCRRKERWGPLRGYKTNCLAGCTIGSLGHRACLSLWQREARQGGDHRPLPAHQSVITSRFFSSIF
jgi:hypothetical protein